MDLKTKINTIIGKAEKLQQIEDYIGAYEEWYIIKFKDGKKAIFGSMSNRVKKIIGEIKL